MRIVRHVTVRGQVQGVGFRYFVVQRVLDILDRNLSVEGWVRNRSDGTVEMLAEGEEDAVKELIGWAHHGPSAARVEDVNVRYRSYTGEHSDFRITE